MDLLGLLMAASLAESHTSFPSRTLLFPRLPTQDEVASMSEVHPTVLTSSAQCQAPDASSSTLQANHEVTLVTQASAERLWMVPHICARWGEAPMVVVALAHDANRLAWPRLGRGARCALTCLELRTTSSGLNNPEKYPINWLRNQGILCVKTTHYFVVDVDFWPSVELLDCIRRQLGTWGDSARALVVPNFQRNGHGCRNDAEQLACRHAFEKDAIGMPNNFSDLRDCLAAKDCSVFDVEYNPQGQSSTDIQAWLARERHDTYAIPCLVSERYEPFVVLQRTSHTPLFDERFHGYGKNKVQLLVHLRYAGYTFDALTRGFVIHFPHPKSVAKQKWLHSGAHARVESLFNTFVRELHALYNQTTHRVPLCKHTARKSRVQGERHEKASEDTLVASESTTPYIWPPQREPVATPSGALLLSQLSPSSNDKIGSRSFRDSTSSDARTFKSQPEHAEKPDRSHRSSSRSRKHPLP